MQVISEYVNHDRKALVTKHCGEYSVACVFFVEYYIDNKLVGRTQHRTEAIAEQIAEQYTDCIDTDLKQFLAE
jgi:hypothetical protein